MEKIFWFLILIISILLTNDLFWLKIEFLVLILSSVYSVSTLLEKELKTAKKDIFYKVEKVNDAKIALSFNGLMSAYKRNKLESEELMNAQEIKTLNDDISDIRKSLTEN